MQSMQPSTTLATVTTPGETVLPGLRDLLDQRQREQTLARAETVMAAITANPNDIGHEDNLNRLGHEAQAKSLKTNHLLETEVGKLMNQVGKDNLIPQTLTEFRVQMERMDPTSVRHEGFWGFFLNLASIIPPLKNKIYSLENRVALVRAKKDSVEETIDAICQALVHHKDQLARDIVGLQQLYTAAAEARTEFARDYYLCDLLAERLKAMIDLEQDIITKNRLEALYEIISRRQRNMTQSEAVAVQAQLAALQNIRINRMLCDDLIQGTQMSQWLLRVGMIITIAQLRQNQAMTAMEQMRNFNDRMFQQNAQDLDVQMERAWQQAQQGMITAKTLELVVRKTLETIKKSEQRCREVAEINRNHALNARSLVNEMDPEVQAMFQAEKGYQQFVAEQDKG